MHQTTQPDKHAEIDVSRQEQSINALQESSKWLISVNFFAAVGCLLVLERGVSLLLQPLLIFAIILFALAVITAALIMGVLPVIIEALPLYDTSGALSSIYDYRIWRGISLSLLVRLEFALLAFGALFFLAWVIARPALA
jgi:hypothetical protein